MAHPPEQDDSIAWKILAAVLAGGPLLFGLLTADWGAYRLARELTESILVQYLHMVTHAVPIAVGYFAGRPIYRRGFHWPAWIVGIVVMAALYMMFQAGFGSLGGGLGRRYDRLFESQGYDGA